MEYKRLNFEDYFTICSENYAGISTTLDIARYKAIKYTYRKKTFEVNYQVRFDDSRNCIQVIFQQTASKSD